MNIEKISAQLDKLALSNELKGASWSVSMRDVKGDLVYGHDNDRFLESASNVKIISTATALLVWGAGHRFQTLVCHSGSIEGGVLRGNLIIKGLGDPTLGSRDFDETQPEKVFDAVFKILSDNDIREIEGRLIIDHSYMESRFLYADRSLEDFPYYYGAKPFAINFMDNSFRIRQNGEGIETEAVNAIDTDLLLSECHVIADKDINEMKVLGCPYCAQKSVYINPNADPTNYGSERLSLAEPHLILSDGFSRYLSTHGIRIKNNTTEHGESMAEIGKILSPPLIDILRNTNFKSNNLFAESIYSLLLRHFSEKGESLNGFWAKQMGNDAFNINDGSGLSRTGFVTTGFISALLMYMHIHKDKYGDLIATLPQLGREGTVADLCKDIDAKNIIRLKTGSMSRVRAYSGMIEGSSPMAFSMIFNNYQCSDADIRAHAEDILRIFALA
jgi:D-alanyl-D-alanine carboxypeptidase/D-alanyl-D-alanine-endopeptidase (penicillin-binding protein 4)